MAVAAIAPSLPVSAVAPEDAPPQAERTKVARYRDGLGLRADDAWIDEVERSVDELNPVWQLKLTAGEAAALEGRRQVQQAADPLLLSLTDDERSDLAGVWFAKEATGRLVMNFTRRVDEHRQALRARFAYPEKLTVGFAPYSLSQLDALMERIEEAIDRDRVSVPFIVRRDIENRSMSRCSAMPMSCGPSS